jgi:hypothetical protein
MQGVMPADSMSLPLKKGLRRVPLAALRSGYLLCSRFERGAMSGSGTSATSGDVRSMAAIGGQSGPEMLTVSSSDCDPEQTSACAYGCVTTVRPPPPSGRIEARTGPMASVQSRLRQMAHRPVNVKDETRWPAADRVGRVQLACRRALVAAGKPLRTTEMMHWGPGALRGSVLRAARRFAVRVDGGRREAI